MSIGLAAAAGLVVLVVLALALALLRRRSMVVRQLRGALAAAALALATLTFALLARASLPDAGLRAWTVTALFSGLAVVHLVALYFFEVRLRSRAVALPPLIPRVLIGTLYLIATLATLPLIFEGLDLAPLLATSAVTSLVLGLALQPILGNFFAGLVISLERPFRINDWIEIDGVEGRVVDITWRTTHVRTRESDNLIVPNSQIAEKALLNFQFPHPLHLETLVVRAHLDTPPYRVTEALLDAAGRVRGVLDKPSPDVFVVTFGESGIDYQLRVWIQDVSERLRIASDCRQRVWEAFRSRGIVIPYPVRTLELDSIATASGIGAAPAVDNVEPAPRVAWLYVEQGPERGRAARITGEPVLVGRGAECDLVISDGRVSKRHFRVERDGIDVVLTDLGSSHGTTIGSTPVDRHVLSPFERIRVGDTILVFEPDAAEAPALARERRHLVPAQTPAVEAAIDPITTAEAQ